MQAHVRADDIVGRYGGEEFVLVFAGQTAALVVETLERLRAELASAQTGGATRFTASYGLADSTVGATVDEILRVADAALATAKREGRDRVIVAPELRAVEAIAPI
jgi:diguanylate cyclase (GGDEF)-like protein